MLFSNECARRRSGVNRMTWMRVKKELSDQYGVDAFEVVKPRVRDEVERAQAHIRSSGAGGGPISEAKERSILQKLRNLGEDGPPKRNRSMSESKAGEGGGSGPPMVLAAGTDGEEDLLMGSGKLYRFKMIHVGKGMSEGNRFIQDDKL